jgi:opacity protein-like surface antigen
MLTRILFSCAALFAATELGIAADMNVTAPIYVSSWTGCYIGGHAGYGVAGATSYYSFPNSSVISKILATVFSTKGSPINDSITKASTAVAKPAVNFKPAPSFGAWKAIGHRSIRATATLFRADSIKAAFYSTSHSISR